MFLLGTVCAFGIPRAKRVGTGETVDERDALHARSIVIAGTAMGLLRSVVGFFTFFAAFALKRSHEPAWVFGMVLIASAVGNLLGTVIAPLLRKKVREEWMLAGALLFPALPLVLAARDYGRVSLVAAAATVAAATACGRVAFDALVQRDGAETVRGRAFARFETRFQLVWVAGGVGRTELDDGYEVARTTADGRVTTYRSQELSDGTLRRTRIGPSGAQTVVDLKPDGTAVCWGFWSCRRRHRHSLGRRQAGETEVPLCKRAAEAVGG